MKAKTRPPPKTRVITYRFMAEAGADEAAMIRVLEKALRDRVITRYDDGRGDFPWVNGPPGADLRALRESLFVLGYRMCGARCHDKEGP